MPTTPAKYLINPLPAGGFPLENEDLLTLQDVHRAALNATLAGLGSHYVLNGCNLVDIDSDGSICYINPGYIFIDGEVRYFAGYSGGYPFYVVSDTNSVTQKTFEDGNAKDTHVSFRTKILTSKPTGVQVVSFTPSPQETIANAITGELAAALAKEITDREVAVATKQTRVTSRIPWTDIILSPSGDYTTSNPNDFQGRDYNKAQYMRTEDGIVHLRGYLKYVGTNDGSYISSQLPAAIQPVKPVTFNHVYGTTYDGITVHRFTISGNFFGHSLDLLTASVTNPVIQKHFWLDGISYSVEA
jgi:hypothetical protein